jgi:transcriptional regulator with XRE-family HTH domain
MSRKDEVREFLISRRAHITPEQAGLPHLGGERRVPGLRREEVATLAGVSIDYYTQLERGKIRGASESVLNAIARALQLNDVEREYLFDLARAPSGPMAPRDFPRTTGRTSADSSTNSSTRKISSPAADPLMMGTALVNVAHEARVR